LASVYPANEPAPWLVDELEIDRVIGSPAVAHLRFRIAR